MDPRVAQVKLDLLWEEGGVTMDTRTEGRVVFRRPAPVPPQTSGFFGFGKKPAPPESGLEVVVELPPAGRGTVEIAARGGFYGNPPAEFARANEKTIVTLLDNIRGNLGNVPERRKHPRLPAAFAVTLYPLHSDGRVEAPVRGYCQDVSAGGLALFCPARPPSKYAYIAFDELPDVAGLALLVQFTRSEARPDEVLLSGRFRLDVGADAK
jgi:eukaryotic-like serine/threonine-protein kinase